MSHSQANKTSPLVLLQWGIISQTGGLHHIFLSHHLISGQRKIWIDGVLYSSQKQFVDAGSAHEFYIQDDLVLVKIVSIRMGTSYRYDLMVNGSNFQEHNVQQSKTLVLFDLTHALGLK